MLYKIFRCSVQESSYSSCVLIFLLLKEETTLPTCRFIIRIDELNIKLYSYIYIIDLVFPIRSLKHDYLLWYITIAVYINLNSRLWLLYLQNVRPCDGRVRRWDRSISYSHERIKVSTHVVSCVIWSLKRNFLLCFVLQIFKLKFVCDEHRLDGDDQLTEAVEKSVYLEVEIMYLSLTVESTNYWDTSTCHRKLLHKQRDQVKCLPKLKEMQMVFL